MADELIQAGIFEGMTWWNTNPAKNFFPSGGLLPPPYCSMAAGVDALASTWAVTDHQIINNNMAVLGCTASTRSSSTFFDQGPPVADSSSLQSMEFHPSNWNPQHIIGGDYNTTVMQVGEWSDLNCGSSPPNSGTDGSTVTCDGQIQAPVDPTSMFPSNLINGDHEILPPCDWNNGTQVMGSSFNQQQQIINHIRATLLGGSPCSSSPSSPKAQSRKRTTNSKGNKNEEGSDSGAEPTFKRQRIETPSSLPTFKVRKEKLGDRITALQQLVSPFGKTDTASVLHEAIEYIKFLHDQVNALSTPYMKNGAPIQPHHHQQQKSKSKGEAATSEDLRSRGLCLVPIASTFPVAHESPADFWTPTFGASSFR